MLVHSVADAALLLLMLASISITGAAAASSLISNPLPTNAITPQVSLSNADAKSLFTQARAYEQQGNLQAAQRLYEKIVVVAPDFVYGWSNLGNTQTALQQLTEAEISYTKAINLCTQLEQNSGGASPQPCKDLYLLYLNRGSLRLNTQQPQLALQDLRQSNSLRGRPDDVILPNLARAYEVNGQYQAASDAYVTSIRMAGNAVAPYWLRASLVEFQLDNGIDGYALLQRVQNRFPDAPEVKAALAVYLWEVRNEQDQARQTFLQIPNKQRLKYSYCSDESKEYLDNVIAWPPKMKEAVQVIAKGVGDC
ncbi:hypothetical protein MPSEU_000693500 [Mayamaea pseudoterrestris]|nr:hypothetical protein MPSEU_000693500 [Mayamaea pseudoterrestris]